VELTESQEEPSHVLQKSHHYPSGRCSLTNSPNRLIARIVKSHRVRPDIVTMHSKVDLWDLKHHGSEVFWLVFPEEADLGARKLSVLNPLGTALLGARRGDVVQVVGAAGPRALKVKAVLYQPEAAIGSGSHDRVEEMPSNGTLRERS
jgi:regulator of nucleoside diphosphate kinase